MASTALNTRYQSSTLIGHSIRSQVNHFGRRILHADHDLLTCLNLDDRNRL